MNGRSEAPSLTVGTAGHIDHGKTALVRALTGRDTDRLAEERLRGMSIELGYAELTLGERRLSLVDVPGHERFVRTMIAGATGIDLFLLVVAADDGVMPQTLEHLAVLRALGVQTGVVALTKVDLVTAAGRDEATAAVRKLLPAARIVAVSPVTGEGLGELRACLAGVAEGVSVGHTELSAENPILHVDRCFVVAGHGTVVTGTLWSGTLRRGDRVVVLPIGRGVRIRSIESHDRTLEAVGPRRRVALNLAGLGRAEISRGDVIAAPGTALSATYRLDVALDKVSSAVLGERRVQVHHGTREAPARVVDLGDGIAQLRLEHPLLARRDDRVVVRRIAPPETLGGGGVIDPAPRRRSRGGAAVDRKERSEEETAPSLPQPAPTPPLAPGPLARRVLAELRADGARPRTPARLAEDLGAVRRDVEGAIAELVAAGAVVRLKADVAYPTIEAERLGQEVVSLVADRGSTSIAEARDAMGLSRKYAQALLEHLDGERILRRDGDRHYPRGRGVS